MVLGTVNAPHRTRLSALELADAISDICAAKSNSGPAFAFFSEVSPELQLSFVNEMGLSHEEVRKVAKHFQALCPFPLAFATYYSN
jgi:hypothetical protein